MYEKVALSFLVDEPAAPERTERDQYWGCVRILFVSTLVLRLPFGLLAKRVEGTMATRCEDKHQRVSGRKGNVYYVDENGERVRARGTGGIDEALRNGRDVVSLPAGSPAPSVSDMTGWGVLPEGAEVMTGRGARVVGRTKNTINYLKREADELFGEDQSTRLINAVRTFAESGALSENETNERLIYLLDQALSSNEPQVVKSLQFHLEKATEVLEGKEVYRTLTLLAAASTRGGVAVELAAKTYLWGSSPTTEVTKATLHEVEAALDGGLIQTVAQPIYAQDGATREGVGVELLVRWANPHRESPEKWAQLVETRLARAQLASAELMVEAWKEESSFYVGVNVSPTALAEAAKEVEEVARKVGPYLRVEITEKEQETPASVAVAQTMQQAGASVAMDDLGTHWSTIEGRKHTLNYMDTIKFDKSLLPGTDPEKDHLYRVGRIAFSDKKIVQEGVETLADLDRVNQEGKAAIQGWVFQQAVSLEEAADLLRIGPTNITRP